MNAIARFVHLKTETVAQIFEDLNSAVLILAIAIFLWKVVPKMLRKRSETLEKELIQARLATDDANRRLAEVEARLLRLDSEIDAIRQQVEQEAVTDEQRIHAALETERERIIASAEQEIGAVQAAAQRDLKKFAANLAIDNAMRRIQLSTDTDRALVREFGKSLKDSGGEASMASFVSRYARAFADVVFEGKLNAKDMQRQLGDFAGAWHESRELREFFLDPSFPLEQKIELLDKLNAKLKMAQQTRNFIAVLIRNDRIAGLDDVVAEFRREVNQRLGISEAKVISARKLDANERTELEQQIAALTGGTVEAQFEEDKSLLGGAVVQVGSTVYDGSVRGRLDRLREELTAN